MATSENTVNGGTLTEQPVAPPVLEVEKNFYHATARDWIRLSSVSAGHGVTMLSRLDDEIDHLSSAPATARSMAYGAQVGEVYKMMGDAMMSAVHRGVFHYHPNQSLAGTGFHIPTDEEELQVSNDPIDDSEDDDHDSISSAESIERVPKHPAKPATAAPESKARKREEAKKRRQEDDDLLLNDRKVRDEKNNLMSTVGPFAPPRLTIRSIKAGRTIPSRKSLTQRAQLDSSDSSSASEDDDAPAVDPPGPSSPDVDTVALLMTYLAPLTMDSLKKMSESAKVKWRGSCTHDEAVSEIVKSAVKLGCEKACVLMDKNKMLDKVATHANTTRAHVLAQLATSVPNFLRTLPEDLLRSLGPTLGIPTDSTTVAEMWERIVAMGFCSVLTHLRPRPLKKIAQELSVALNDSASTEKHCDQIVYTAFPRERLRVKQSKSLKKAPGVGFRVVPNRCRCVGDMGYMDFEVRNVTGMRHDSERHYSPEFEFANLRWSLLCMANKDALALYLCQQGTVHCKFVIAIVNHLDLDGTVYNEGTQKFSSASAENDWGFNNVVKFDFLLDPKNGFWQADTDHVVISVGIVLVEATSRASTSIISNNPPVGKQGREQPGGKGGKNAGKERERIVEAVANQLLESERQENLRKKVKADLQKTQREEEKQRRDHAQKQQRSFQQLMDQHNSDRNRIQRDLVERERREQQERTREQERLRHLQDQNDELKRKVAAFTTESAELAVKKKNAMQDVKDERKRLEGLKGEVAEADSTLSALQKELDELNQVLAKKTEANLQLRTEIEETKEGIPEPPEQAAPDGLAASESDADLLRSVQNALAGIVDDGW